MSSRVLALWCPDWPAVAAGRQERIDEHRPLAVIGARGVLACTASARQSGVVRGLRRREAQFRCPELRVVAEDADRDAAHFEVVAQALDEIVSGVEILRPGLVVHPLRGSARYYGGEDAVAERLIDAAANVGVECLVGIADELPSAVLAARQGAAVPRGGDADYLGPLPLSLLVTEPALRGRHSIPTPPRAKASQRTAESRGVDVGELVDLLSRLGVHTMGDFAALPVRDVFTRFGAYAAYAHRIASGIPVRPPHPREIPEDIQVRHECDPPLEHVDSAALLGRSLARLLHERLAAAGLACTRLAVTAVAASGREQCRVWRCTDPLTPERTAERIRWQLDGWLTATARTGERPGPLVRLSVEPIEVVPAGHWQPGLWGEIGEVEERAQRVLERVQSLLGPEAVRVPVPAAGREPSAQVELVPHGGTREPGEQENSPWPGRIPSPLPSITYPGRERKSVLLVDSGGNPITVVLRGGLSAEPSTLRFGTRSHLVEGWSPVWVLDENWWEPGLARHSAWMQVQAQGLPALLLSRELGELGEELREGAHQSDTAAMWQIEAVYS